LPLRVGEDATGEDTMGEAGDDAVLAAAVGSGVWLLPGFCPLLTVGASIGLAAAGIVTFIVGMVRGGGLEMEERSLTAGSVAGRVAADAGGDDVGAIAATPLFAEVLLT
jgi:hypothetical protein